MALAFARVGGIIENFAWHHHMHEFDLDLWHTNAPKDSQYPAKRQSSLW